MELEQIDDCVQLLEKGSELLKDNPRLFLSNLRHLIRHGEEKCSVCIILLELLAKHNKSEILLMDKEDQTVLHLAATFHSCTDLIYFILNSCPRLVGAQRTGLFQGQTFLHIILCKGESWKFYSCIRREFRLECMTALATGKRFSNTPLMGETLLSVAAIRGLKKLMCELLQDGASLTDQNSKGDTVLHSLVRYANINQSQRDSILDILAFLHNNMLGPGSLGGTKCGQAYARAVWFTENYERQTPLQLAAQLGDGKLFTFIINLQWVYCMLYDYDGLFDINRYDITEVDTVAKLEWIRQNRDEVSSIKTKKRAISRLKNYLSYRDALLARQSSPAILETICETDIDGACAIIASPIIRSVIRGKWKSYRYVFYSMAVFHVLFMSAVTVYAQYKVEIIEKIRSRHDGHTLTDVTDLQTNTSGQSIVLLPERQNYTSFDSSSNLVTGFCSFLFTPMSLLLYIEIFRTLVHRKPWQLHLIHHNGSYRLLLTILALSLLVDSVWYLLSPTTNHKLVIIVALITGWWYTLFFLRPFKKFSMFTVMLQKVLFGDMFRFSTVILLQLLSFTAAFRLLFHNSQVNPVDFRNFPVSLFTMFKLMLGGDLDNSSPADPTWLAVVLTVVFVLLTSVLLMTSLVATMSNTVAEIAEQKVKLWQVQRLSVILFIEQLLMAFGLARTAGKKNYIVKFGYEQETRYFIEKSKGLSSFEDVSMTFRHLDK